MPKPKIVENPVRISLVISQEQLDIVRKTAIKISQKEDRIVTISSALRSAIKKVYPTSEDSNEKNEKEFSEIK